MLDRDAVSPFFCVACRTSVRTASRPDDDAGHRAAPRGSGRRAAPTAARSDGIALRRRLCRKTDLARLVLGNGQHDRDTAREVVEAGRHSDQETRCGREQGFRHTCGNDRRAAEPVRAMSWKARMMPHRAGKPMSGAVLRPISTPRLRSTLSCSKRDLQLLRPRRADERSGEPRPPPPKDAGCGHSLTRPESS
jgi:hypothetical protein